MILFKLEDFDIDNTLIDEKSHENTLIYEILYKILIGPKLLQIRFKKIEFNKIYDETLFGSEKYDAIYDRIRYLIYLKTGITYIFSHYFAKSKLILIILCL